MGNKYTERQSTERVVSLSLLCEAQLKSDAIRQRLAAVANDLRVAAAESEIGSDHLLSLASRFERQSRAGDNV